MILILGTETRIQRKNFPNRIVRDDTDRLIYLVIDFLKIFTRSNTLNMRIPKDIKQFKRGDDDFNKYI